jgi:hypothetical protein
MRQSRGGLPLDLVLIAAVLMAACAAPTKTEVSFAPGPHTASLAAGGVVLFPSVREHPDAREAGFVRCLRGGVAKRLPSQLSLMDTPSFQDALFPWFEAENAPRTVEELNSLLGRPMIRDRIASLGVRYLLVIASAARSDGFPGIICGAGYCGGGCLGVFWEDKKHRAQAVIWDLERGAPSGTLVATSSGRSVGLAFGTPLVFIAGTEASACEALAAELVRLLASPVDSETMGR